MSPAGLDVLVAELQALLAAGIVVFFRVGAAMAVLPGLGERSIPMRVRLVAALALTAIVAPVVTGHGAPAPAESGPASMALAVVVESAVGLAFGLTLRLLVFALETAGSIAAQSTSLAQMFGGLGEPQPAFAQLLTFAGLAAAFAAGLHTALAEYLIETYAIVPLGARPDAATVLDWHVGALGRAFGLAFALAMPFVAGSLVYNLALGVINRAMPQLMVAMIGAPALTLGALALLAVTAVTVIGAWFGQFSAFLMAPGG